MPVDRWVTVDHFGLSMPADPSALRSGGTAFLTDAFRAAGVLDAAGSVTRISEFEEVAGGSTGRKVCLRVEYDNSEPGYTELFAKFSRDFDDPVRDRGKTQMKSEVLFASLSREPGFPITVPAAQFAAANRGLLSADIVSPQLVSRLRVDAPRLLEHEQAVWDYLAGQIDYIALCHWNANIDNAWFWRDADGVLCCGLLDWGCVGQMNVAMALWGALSGAELDLWDHHLDELLNVFVDEIRRCGGTELSVDELRCQLMLYVGIMTVAWLLDVPALIRSRFGDAAAAMTRKHPLIKNDESVRAPLQMLSNALNL